METQVMERDGLALRADDLPADLETPVSAFLKLRPLGARFLLESAETGGALGRFSFIGFGDTEVVARAGGSADPLAGVEGLLSRREGPAPRRAALLGGCVGYVSYDYVRSLERLDPPRPIAWPLAHFVRVDCLLVFDHLRHRVQVLSLPGSGTDGLHDEIPRALAAARPAVRAGAGRAPAFRSSAPREAFEGGVRACKEYIRAGDAFQIVLSRSLETRVSADPFSIYRALRMANPSPYMFYLDFGLRKLVGSSPEMVVKLEGRRARISPIAGTRPRGKSAAEDQALADALLADEKERAEHVMLVDLARNDLSRCCAPGSVEVTHMMRVEKYSHVQHIVSDVFGRLADGRTAFDLLRAAFPAGTVTGAPKVRAMEIIDELETAGRGPYAGCVGYVSPSGDMDTCLSIRTVSIEGDRAVLQAGAGIVADSDPVAEFEETENKLAAARQAVVRAEEGGL